MCGHRSFMREQEALEPSSYPSAYDCPSVPSRRLPNKNTRGRQPSRPARARPMSTRTRVGGPWLQNPRRRRTRTRMRRDREIQATQTESLLMPLSDSDPCFLCGGPPTKEPCPLPDTPRLADRAPARQPCISRGIFLRHPQPAPLRQFVKTYRHVTCAAYSAAAMLSAATGSTVRSRMHMGQKR